MFRGCGRWRLAESESPREPLVPYVVRPVHAIQPEAGALRRPPAHALVIAPPVSAPRPESVAPALLSMEAQWASLVSYGMRLAARKDFLPLAVTLEVQTVRYATLKVAKRIDAELGDEPPCFIAGHPRDWALLPCPAGAGPVGSDGGDGRHGCATKPTCEVMMGQRPLSCSEAEADQASASTRLGFVPTLETTPKRRLYEVVPAQGLQMHQASTVFSAGNATFRALQVELSPQALQSLDWLHRTMTLTVFGQFGKGLGHCEGGEERGNQLERLTGSLGHGQVDKALGQLDALGPSIAPCNATYARCPRLGKALSALRPSIGHNRPGMPHAGER